MGFLTILIFVASSVVIPAGSIIGLSPGIDGRTSRVLAVGRVFLFLVLATSTASLWNIQGASHALNIGRGIVGQDCC